MSGSSSGGSERSTVLYLIRAACPDCREVTGFVEARNSPVPLMQDVEVDAKFCPNCGYPVQTGSTEWDVHEESEIERVKPMQERKEASG